MGFTDQRIHLSPTGAELYLYVKQTEGVARGVIQINHGLAEHALRYARFADVLARRGFHVYAHDHRGHGHTRAPDAPPRRFAARNGSKAVIADVDAVHDLIAQEHPGLPVIVFGHSMGGLITMNYVLRHPARVHAAAVWNANFSAGLRERAALAVLAWERFRLGSDVPSPLLPKLTFQAWAREISDRRTDFDWLSRDREEVDRYMADPLCGWAPSVSMWRDVFDFIFYGADDRNFSGLRRDLPFNLVGGGADPFTEGGKAVLALARRMKRMGFSNVVSEVYADTRHESLNELNRDLITDDFVAWAESITR